MLSWIRNLFTESFDLKQAMPLLRGKIDKNVLMAKKTWLGVGGNAEFLYTPADEDDLYYFLSTKPNLPLTVLGGCSNVLIRDGGIPGVVVMLGDAFKDVFVEGPFIRCGAFAKNTAIAQAALEAGLSGFEFLAGIPGTVGGALRMNAGAHGRAMQDITLEIGIIDTNGHQLTITKSEMVFEYRKTALPDNWIFTKALFKGVPDSKENIKKRMQQYKEAREKAQPQGVKTAGSMFKNPVGLKAWELIDKAGCRGMRLGGAMVSEKHCNFFINTGTATANDLENLALKVQEKVYDISQIQLEWEVRRIGVKTKRFSSFGGK